MKKYFYIGFLFLMGLTACEQELNLIPKDTLVKESFFSSANDFKLYTNYFYNHLQGFGRCGEDNHSDIAFHFSSIANSKYIESQGSGMWNDRYNDIRRYNILLEEYAKLEEGDFKADAEIFYAETKFFRAYAYFRLLKEFGGVPIIDKALTIEDEKLFGARDDFYAVVDFIVKDLDDAIATQKLGTLKSGADDGRVGHFAAVAFKARVCLFAGTWAKYHNNGGDANKYLTLAKTASKDVIDNGGFSLFKEVEKLGSVDESYRNFFTLETETQSNIASLGKDDQNEIILKRKFDRMNQRTGYISLTSGNLSPTKKMADMFLDNTGLPITHSESVFEGHGFTIDAETKVVNNIEFNKRDPRMAANFIQPFEQFFYHTPYHRDFSLDSQIGKGSWNEGFWTSNTGYLLHKFCPETEGNGIAIDYPEIRLAEVLLIFAESTFELNGSITDDELNVSINKLRERVDMPALTNEFVSSKGLNMLTEIRRERTVELCFEGFRFNDLRRWKTAETELEEDVKGVQWANSVLPTEFEVYNEQTGGVFTVTTHTNSSYDVDADGFLIRETAADRQFDENKHYLKPLPLRQLAINPSLEQNPGWAKQ